MTLWRPDSTFYPSPRMAMQAPPEGLAYVATLSTADDRPDALSAVDVDPQSGTYGQVVGRVEMPHPGDELPPLRVERLQLGPVPLRTPPAPGAPVPDHPWPPLLPDPHPGHEGGPPPAPARQGHRATGRGNPRRVFAPAHRALWARGDLRERPRQPGGRGPGGVFLLDHESFDVLGRWEVDRGPQYLAYDFWWHLGHDTLVTSEWGTPKMVEGGLVPEALLQGQYGRRLHLWDLRHRRHVQTLDLGEDQQMVLELRPAHDPTKPYGFVGVVVSLKDLSGSVWLWHHADGSWEARKVVEIPAEPADPDQLPPLLKEFGAVPPLVTDIDLSLDDRFLYVSCWGTGELRRYDVTDPFDPRPAGSVRLGGIVARAPHPQAGPLTGGPQMVEVSRDGRRVYVTNSLYLPGTSSSTPGASGAGWPRSTPLRTAPWPWTPSSSWTSGRTGPIRSAWRVGTPPPIHTATPSSSPCPRRQGTRTHTWAWGPRSARRSSGRSGPWPYTPRPW